MGRKRITLNGPNETIQFGAQFASKLAPKSVLALKGDLGAGKTTFVQGLLDGFNIQDTAQSPTFTYLQIYQSSLCTIYHFDLYRLSSEKDFLLLGFDEFLDQGVAVIEWPERIASLLSPNTSLIHLTHYEHNRKAEITTWGQREI